jgi:hypothetical protein
MKSFRGRATRRGAGFAAAVVVAGGLAGTVLLTPGTAFASPQVSTTKTSISVTQVQGNASGKTLDVSVSVTSAVGTPAPSGAVAVTVFGHAYACTANLVTTYGDTSYGGCSLGWVPNGTYGIHGTYAANGNDENSFSSYDWVTVSGPATPPPPPVGNHHNGHVSASLNCPASVRNGGTGTCTLTVTNDSWAYGYGYGKGSATDVTAQISLPRQLHADSCAANGHRQWWAWNGDCSISGNTASAHLGSLGWGDSQTLSITFTAHSYGGWYWGHRHSVEVTGSASTNGNWNWGPGRTSTSTAWVSIPPSWW